MYSRVHKCQGFFFFSQDQEIVRELCDVSGKNELCKNVMEMSGNFTCGFDEARMFGLDVFVLLNLNTNKHMRYSVTFFGALYTLYNPTVKSQSTELYINMTRYCQSNCAASRMALNVFQI